MKIILDTNFLMIPAELNVDIFEEIKQVADFNYELFIIDKTIDELKDIKNNQKGRYKGFAKLALQLIENKHINAIKTESIKNVDKLIIEEAEKEKIAVATQDSALKKALKLKGAKIISLRQKKRLIIE